MPSGTWVVFIGLVLVGAIGYFAWRGRDNGPLGIKDFNSELQLLSRQGSLADVNFLQIQLLMSAGEISRSTKLQERWFSQCQTLIEAQRRLGVEPGVGLAESLRERALELQQEALRNRTLRKDIRGVQISMGILDGLLAKSEMN